MSGQPQPSRLSLPAGFPDDLFEEVKNRIGTQMPAGSLAAGHLAGRQNGVRYRVRAETVRKVGVVRPLAETAGGPNSRRGMVSGEPAVQDGGSHFQYQIRAHRRSALLLVSIHSPMRQPLHGANSVIAVEIGSSRRRVGA